MRMTKNCADCMQTHTYIHVHTCMGGWMRGSRIRYSMKNVVLIRDLISEISP